MFFPVKFWVIAEPGRPDSAFGEDLPIPGIISAISQHFPNTEPPPLSLTAAGTEEPEAGGERQKSEDALEDDPLSWSVSLQRGHRGCWRLQGWTGTPSPSAQGSGAPLPHLLCPSVPQNPSPGLGAQPRSPKDNRVQNLELKILVYTNIYR